MITAAAPGHDAGMRWLCAAMVVAIGCGDGIGVTSDGGRDGAVAPDVTLDGPVDVLPDVPTATVPVITSVATADGFTQIRQGGTETIVITGTGLGGVATVTVGTIAATIQTVTSTEVRVTLVIPHGHRAESLDLAVSSPSGTATRTQAIDVTVIVVAPGATGGHGTFQSPMALCDLKPGGIATTGDTVRARAGTHVCGGTLSLSGVVAFHGESAPETIVKGTAAEPLTLDLGLIGAPATTLDLHDLTLAQPMTQVLVAGSQVEIERIRLEAPLRTAPDTGNVSLAAVDGTGAASFTLELDGTLLADDVHIADCTRAFRIDGAPDDNIHVVDAHLERVFIERCTTGIEIGTVPDNAHATQNITVHAGLQIDDADVGVRIADGNVILSGSLNRPKAAGIDMPNGRLAFSGFISDVGAGGSAIHAHASSNGSGFDPNVRVTVDTSTFSGGSFGVNFSAFDSGSGFHITNSTMRDHTTAALRCVGDDTSELVIRNSVLSVTGGFCIDDARSSPFPTFGQIDAFQTTVNGMGFLGAVFTGPITNAPLFRIAGEDGSIQF